VGPGTQFTEVRKFLGRRMESSLEVTEFEPERTFTLKTTSGPVPFTIVQRFEPADGGTRIRVSGEGEPGGFFKVAEPLVGRQVKRMLEHSFATLKDLLESGAG
jgi:carbon monoxide dehydrogenase subunit G